MNILVIDYTGDSAQWMSNFCKNSLNVLHTITPDEKYWTKYIEACEYDAIFIFEVGKREMFNAMAELFNIPNERIIFAKDFNSWLSHKWAVHTFLNENSFLFKTIDHLEEKNKRKYTSCSVDDLSYIGYASDSTIMLEMYRSNSNWSKRDMIIFNELSNKFYDISGKKYFLDLGANIGTTSIYFHKKIDPSVKVLAFEADPETYKILRANFILNEMPEDSIIENYGLADKEGEMFLHRSPSNPGANSFINNHNRGEVSVRLVALDDYFEQKNIHASEIKYIWIDTEGFESQVFFGMKKLVTTENIPIFFELNPSCYVNNGTFDDFINLIISNYKSYIDINEIKNGSATVHNVNDLWNYKERTDQTDIFLIK